MASISDPTNPMEGLIKQFQQVAETSSFKEALRVAEENSRLRDENRALNTANEQNLKTLARLQQRLDDQAQQAANKSSMLETLAKEKKGLQTSLAAAHKAIGEKKKELEETATQITNLQALLKKREKEIDNFKDRLNKGKDSLNAASAAKNQAQKELASSQEALNAQTKRLNWLDQFIFKMKEPHQQTITPQLHAIFKSVYAVAEHYFGVDLDGTVLANPTRWDNIRNHNLVKRNIPLPLSNTPAAKQMRIAAVLGICAEALDRYIFQPTYLLKDNKLPNLLTELGEDDPARESYLRSVLLPIQPDKQRENGQVRAGLVVTDVVDCAGSMLPNEGQEAFRSSLTNVCKDACDQWMRLQELETKIESDFETDGMDKWTLLPFPLPDGGTQRQKVNSGAPPANNNSKQQARVQDQQKVDIKDIRVVVWPAFILPKDGQIGLLQKGFVLGETQVKAARDEENAALLQGTRRTARQLARKARTLSMSMADDETNPKGAFLSIGGGGGEGGA